MRSILIYFGLVGLPLLGVLGILRVGAGLEAPPDIGGTWRAGLAPSAQLVPPCVELGHEMPSFDVSQSGIHVGVTLHDAARTRLDGRLTGTRLWGQAPRLPLVGTARNACPDATLELAADVSSDGRERLLVGNLWAGGCAACAPVSFRAERASGGR